MWAYAQVCDIFGRLHVTIEILVSFHVHMFLSIASHSHASLWISSFGYK